MQNNKLNMLWLVVILSLLLTACGGSRQEPAENTTAETTVQTTAPEETIRSTTESTAAVEETTEATEETTEPTEETTAPTTGNAGDDDDDPEPTKPTEPKLEVPDPGTEKNPYVEVLSDYPGQVETVNIPTKGSVSYLIWGSAGKVLTIENADAKLTVGTDTYTADVDGVLTADLSRISTDTVISLTNAGQEAQVFQVSVTEPVGTKNNPVELTDITSLRMELDAGDYDGIWYRWTAPETGRLTLSVQPSDTQTPQGGFLRLPKLLTSDVPENPASEPEKNLENAIADLMAALTDADAPTLLDLPFEVIVTAGDQTVKLSECTEAELSVEVKKGKKITIQTVAQPDGTGTYPAVTAELSGTLTIKPGSNAEHAVLIENLSDPYVIAMDKDDRFYFTGDFSGRVLTIADAQEATLTADGETCKPDESGTIAVSFPKKNGEKTEPDRLCLTAGADKTYTLVFGYPLGTPQNPQTMATGENRATLTAGNTEGYSFLWKSEKTGKLTITMAADTNWQYTLKGEKHNSGETPAVNPVVLALEAGQEVVFTVNTFDPEKPESAPEGTVIFETSFVEAPLALELGEMMITLAPGDANGCRFVWTAKASGSFTITMPEGAAWRYAVKNVTTGLSCGLHTSGDVPLVLTETISVTAGDVVEILVNSFDPENPMEFPGGDMVFFTEFAAAAD